VTLRNNLNSVRARPVLVYAGVPVLVTAFLWATSSNQLSPGELVAALMLCWIPWASYQQWYRGSRQELPLFSLIAAMYWIAYGLPLFWSSHNIGLVSGNHVLSESAIARAMYLVVIGVVAIWIGMRVLANWRWEPSFLVGIPQNPWRWNYLRIVLMAAALMRILIPITAWGEGGRQIIVNIESFVASIAFVILLRSWLSGVAMGVDKLLVSGYVLVAVVVGSGIAVTRLTTDGALDTAYYAHSFACPPADPGTTTAWTMLDGDRFPAIVRRERTVGVQFHPEKSSAPGVRFIHRFLADVASAREETS